jgi:hypothetical protein
MTRVEMAATVVQGGGGALGHGAADSRPPVPTVALVEDSEENANELLGQHANNLEEEEQEGDLSGMSDLEENEEVRSEGVAAESSSWSSRFAVERAEGRAPSLLAEEEETGSAADPAMQVDDLSTMSNRQLRAWATAGGATAEQLNDAADSADMKVALMKLVTGLELVAFVSKAPVLEAAGGCPVRTRSPTVGEVSPALGSLQEMGMRASLRAYHLDLPKVGPQPVMLGAEEQSQLAALQTAQSEAERVRAVRWTAEAPAREAARKKTEGLQRETEKVAVAGPIRRAKFADDAPEWKAALWEAESRIASLRSFSSSGPPISLPHPSPPRAPAANSGSVERPAPEPPETKPPAVFDADETGDPKRRLLGRSVQVTRISCTGRPNAYC